MGEKEIVEDGPGGTNSGQSGGSSTTGNPPAGPGGGVGVPGGDSGGGATDGGPKTPGGGSGGGGGQQADDCAQIEFQIRDLLAQFEAAHQKNMKASQSAVTAFDAYKDAIQSAKITEAVVDSNNAVGTKMIEAALYAAKKLGGGEHVDKDWVEKADKAKDEYLKGLADWMKEGATEGPNKRAAETYADFAGKATAANAVADEMKDILKQIEKLKADAKAKNCPGDIAIPQQFIRTFDIGTFGQGALKNEKGPMFHRENPDGSLPATIDMFAKPQDLPHG